MEYTKRYDTVIVGGGPAGLSAAIYMARARYSTLVLEKETFGGQITITSEVVNYPGVPKTSGRALTEEMKRQAESFGADFAKAEVYSLEQEDDVWTLRTGIGKIQTFGVILAVGASPKKIGFPGEETWKGRGVAYCATCDGEFFTGKEVFVIGGGYAAAGGHVSDKIRQSGTCHGAEERDELRQIHCGESGAPSGDRATL